MGTRILTHAGGVCLHTARGAGSALPAPTTLPPLQLCRSASGCSKLIVRAPSAPQECPAPLASSMAAARFPLQAATVWPESAAERECSFLQQKPNNVNRSSCPGAWLDNSYKSSPSTWIRSMHSEGPTLRSSPRTTFCQLTTCEQAHYISPRELVAPSISGKSARKSQR